MPVTGADVLVQGLINHGVEHLFGMPGSHSTAIYDALKRSGKIATVLVRNEQAGAFMADGLRGWRPDRESSARRPAREPPMR